MSKNNAYGCDRGVVFLPFSGASLGRTLDGRGSGLPVGEQAACVAACVAVCVTACVTACEAG